jgi:hypothetical protein
MLAQIASQARSLLTLIRNALPLRKTANLP